MNKKPGVYIVNKKEGETPLEALESFRKKNKKYKNAKITYAGRLDPLARGLLLLLVGDRVKEKEKYLKLQKEYEFSILFGFTTDTYDILGKVKKAKKLVYEKSDLEKKIKENLKFFTGKFSQKYPIYSSKTVDGKPLFAYARAGQRVEVPEREVNVKSLRFLKLNSASAKILLKNIEHRIAKVNGDFRQAEILKKWRTALGKNLNDKFFIASFHIKCGSGTYVRSIANSMGERIGAPALAFFINRTKIGNWDKEE